MSNDLVCMCNGVTQESKEFHIERRQEWYVIDKDLGKKIYDEYPSLVTTTYCPACYDKAMGNMDKYLVKGALQE